MCYVLKRLTDFFFNLKMKYCAKIRRRGRFLVSSLQQPTATIIMFRSLQANWDSHAVLLHEKLMRPCLIIKGYVVCLDGMQRPWQCRVIPPADRNVHSDRFSSLTTLFCWWNFCENPPKLLKLCSISSITLRLYILQNTQTDCFRSQLDTEALTNSVISFRWAQIAIYSCLIILR